MYICVSMARTQILGCVLLVLYVVSSVKAIYVCNVFSLLRVKSTLTTTKFKITMSDICELLDDSINFGESQYLENYILFSDYKF